MNLMCEAVYQQVLQLQFSLQIRKTKLKIKLKYNVLHGLVNLFQGHRADGPLRGPSGAPSAHHSC